MLGVVHTRMNLSTSLSVDLTSFEVYMVRTAPIFAGRVAVASNNLCVVCPVRLFLARFSAKGKSLVFTWLFFRATYSSTLAEKENGTNLMPSPL